MSSPLLNRLVNGGRQRTIKTVIKVLLVILLGALGSGLWDAVLKPSLRHVGFWILDISAFGVESYRASVYEQIAKDPTNLGSPEALSLITTFFALALAVYVQHMFFEVRRARRAARKHFEDQQAGDLNSGPTLESTHRAVQDFARFDVTLRRLIYAVIFLGSLIIAMLVVNLARLTYVNSALLHYHQVLTIASPFLSDAERRKVESSFAQVEGKPEYVAAVDQLADIARQHGQRVPAFNAW